MSGTGASITLGGGGIMLPAPVLRTARNYATVAYSVDGASVTPKSIASVSVHGLPQAVMDDLGAFKPKLELMRYVSTRSRQQGIGRNWTTNGYVHPSHGPAPSGNGSHTHGGIHSASAGLAAIRPTEWDVANWGQVIDVTQGMHGFMVMRRVAYRMPSTGLQNTGVIDAVVPSVNTSVSFGRRFPYGRNFRPGYFKFRWSIIDPTDDRGQRITGPLSDTVSLSAEIFPFLPADAWLDPVNGDYHATATIDPRYQPRVTRMWVGSVSRLPF